ncbi:hypothetical protein [Arthrobacter sp. ISL-30]|uniref:hypothetical protein n=1 Tax=Arthrobacter sp. ISL-30 TaxID=2819109 RepID=UPI001BECCC5B|nr:hypothetical protein [Arthrobacter sp. ISL-30]MBT2515217.1 hypothetical protein [Arthrobacter sp. ISL-30]
MIELVEIRCLPWLRSPDDGLRRRCSPWLGSPDDGLRRRLDTIEVHRCGRWATFATLSTAMRSFAKTAARL